MGTGKTTIGKYISSKTNMEFLDTDEIIVKTIKMDIEQIFQRYGERYFRELENKVIRYIYSKNNTIISTGGGIVLNCENINLLKKTGFIFLLQGSLTTILNNLRRSNIKRPLLKSQDCKSKVKQLMECRKKLYEKSADYIIDIDDKSVKAISREILNIYYKNTES